MKAIIIIFLPGLLRRDWDWIGDWKTPGLFSSFVVSLIIKGK
jgi:hypothetical protein